MGGDPGQGVRREGAEVMRVTFNESVGSWRKGYSTQEFEAEVVGPTSMLCDHYLVLLTDNGEFTVRLLSECRAIMPEDKTGKGEGDAK